LKNAFYAERIILARREEDIKKEKGLRIIGGMSIRWLLFAMLTGLKPRILPFDTV
jgi:hypothetical protein